MKNRGKDHRVRCSVFRLLRVWAVFLAVVGASVAVASEPDFKVEGDTLCIRNGDSTLQVSLKSPVLEWGEEGVADATAPLRMTGGLATAGTLGDDQALEIAYAPAPAGPAATIETKLFLRWSPKESVLRKWASIRLVAAESRLLNEVVLDRIDVQGRSVWTHGAHRQDRQTPSDSQYNHPIFYPLDWQSHPVFMPGLFLGMEHPVASTRREEERIVLAHRPGVRVQPGVPYETRTAVYGIVPVGREPSAFQRYIGAHRLKPQGFHINYNSWWTAPIPRYAESDILKLMGVFEARLQKERGTAFDSFSIDMGWSDANSIWEIDTGRFPQKFARIHQGARNMGARLGLWISPGSLYPPALDGEWAKAQGFETNSRPSGRYICLGGEKYSACFKDRLADLVDRCSLSHLKLDGYVGECPETDHGHQPGVYSSEAIAEGMIAAVAAARKSNPDVWLEATCFGWNPSPWWLWHVNSVIGTFGDDAPAGRAPAPVYRESYTTARDFFNLQGASLLPIPISAQEVLGIIHQSPEPFLNDAVATVMRGHMFLPLYVNPKFMSDARWDALARLLQWARNNAEVLEQTVPLLPVSWQRGGVPRFTDEAPMPREPYGYSHVVNRGGKFAALVMLRNPWIAPQSYTLKLDGGLGFSPDAKDLSAVSLYPEPRTYAQGLKYGDAVQIPLAPYETLVLALNNDQSTAELPLASAAAGTHLKVDNCDHKVWRRAPRNDVAANNKENTSEAETVKSIVHVTCNARVQVASPRAELLLLCEGGKAAPTAPSGQLTINGRTVDMEAISSAAGWTAAVFPHHEHWLFLRAPLAAGDNAIAIDQCVNDGCTKISAWVWATKPGGKCSYPNALPQPESISLGGARLFAIDDVAAIPAETARVERPANGIAANPSFVSQRPGAL